IVIFLEEGKFKENFYLNDTLQFGVHRITSSAIYWDGEVCLIIDVGTSDNVTHLIRTLHKFKIPYQKIRGVLLSHYHFDHGGGALNLWKRISRKNPDFRIIVPEDMKNKLQNAKEHLIGAKTTFGDFIGTMDPVSEEAYEIVKKDQELNLGLEDYKVIYLSTPGHCNDHCSPMFVNKETNKCEFLFAGEAAGTLFHGSRLISLPTSMPSNFHYDLYMKSLEKIINAKPEAMGMGHFGIIVGLDDIMEFLKEHQQYMKNLRNRIIELYNENPSTRFIVEHIGKELWEDRVDPYYFKSKMGFNFFSNLRLALVYGMLIDLGFRKSKYERREPI
ncbi:MAG: MBL fold metallo-hydrolase, partial [Promethearchaeota archaeon]